MLSSSCGNSKSITAAARFRAGASVGPLLVYLIAIGPAHYHAVLSLFIAPLVLASNSPDIDQILLFIGVGLGLLGPLFSFSANRILAWRSETAGNHALSKKSSRDFFIVGIALGIVAILCVELPLVETRRQILNALSMKGRVEEEQLRSLREPGPRRIVERLCFPPMQFSSSGALYACGPIDVFGPLCHIINKFTPPGRDTQSPLRNKVAMRALFDMLVANEQGAKPEPRSWRGLSPWEE